VDEWGDDGDVDGCGVVDGAVGGDVFDVVAVDDGEAVGEWGYV
jgi:hypothetical protein